MSDKTDIVAIIKQYTSLEKRGDIYIGYCPFCGNAEERMIVRPDTNEWHCFQCGAGGDAEDFVALYEGLILHRTQTTGGAEVVATEKKTAKIEEATAHTEEAEEHPLSDSTPALESYFSRLRKVSGYLSAAVIDGNMQILAMDRTTDTKTDYNKLNELFISILDDSHAVFGQNPTTLESEIILSSANGIALFGSLYFREEPVHVIVLGSEPRQQYLMRMQINLLKKL